MLRNALLAVVLAATTATGSRRADSVTAFTDVTVIPMDTERLLEHHTVIIRDGRIAALGPTATTPVPDDATVVDGAGKFLIPGLVDMHIHLNDTSAAVTGNYLKLFLANGVTTVRVLSGNRRHLTLRDSISSGVLLGPSVYVVGASVGALPGNDADLRRVLNSAEVSRFAADMKRAGFDFVQISPTIMRSEYEQLVNAARKEGLPLTGSVPTDAGIERVMRARQASVENLEGYAAVLERDDSPLRYADPVTRARRLHEYFDEAKLPKLASSIRSAGVANTPTLFINHVGTTQQAAESLAAWPEMRYVPPRVLASWIRSVRRAQEQTTNPEAGRRVLDYRNRLTKGLSDGGALILAGSDGVNPFVVPGYGTIYEIHSLTVAGLSRYQALRAATRNAAEFVHAENEFGAVAPGLRADLVLLEGNPLEDVGNLTLRAGVMLRGRWMPRTELDSTLNQIAESYRTAP